MGGLVSREKGKVEMKAENAEVTFITTGKCLEIEFQKVEFEDEKVRIKELITKLATVAQDTSAKAEEVPKIFVPKLISLADQYIKSCSIKKTLDDQNILDYIDGVVIDNWRRDFEDITRRIKVCANSPWEKQEQEINYTYIQCQSLLHQFDSNPVFINNCLATGNVLKEFCLIYLTIGVSLVAFNPSCANRFKDELIYIKDCITRFSERVVKGRLDCVLENPLHTLTFEDHMRTDMETLRIPIPEIDCLFGPLAEKQLKMYGEKETQLFDYRKRLEKLYGEYFGRIIELVDDTEILLKNRIITSSTGDSTDTIAP